MRRARTEREVARSLFGSVYLELSMVLSRKFLVRIADFFFDEPAVLPKGVDVVRYVQTSRPLPGSKPVAFYTVLVDLRKDAQSLLACCRNNTRYEIVRAAERDNLDCCWWRTVDSTTLKMFCDFFDRSAVIKGQPRVSRARLRTLARSDVLDLSVARSGGHDLVWHAHLVVKERVRLLESASLFRASDDPEYKKLVGRANRYLHWLDMLHFQAEGVLVYDFGGWTPAATHAENIGINRFKEGFGGHIVQNYTFQTAITVRGRVALAVRQWLRGTDAVSSFPNLLKTSSGTTS